MRIALVTREFPPETSWGGIGSFYSEFARALSAAGHEVEVFCQSLSTTRSGFERGVLIHRVVVRSDLTGPEVPDHTGGNVDLGIFVYSLATGMLAAVKARHAVRPFDIIEGHEHLGINALINAAEPPGAITVTRYHAAHHSLVKRGVVDWPASEWVRLLEKQSIHAARLRIAPSYFINTVVQADFQAPPAEAVIPHFLGEKIQHVANDAPRENILLFVGRLDLRLKRPDLVVSAFQRLAYEFPDWRLHLAGADNSAPGGGTTWEACRKLIPVELEPRIRYFGQLSREEVQAAYRSAKMLVVPSSFEAFGMVALEAMQAGCVPVVASDTALVDVVQDEDLVFANGNVDALVERLRRLMASEQDLAVKRQECATRINVAFSARHLLDSNERVFAAAAAKLRMEARAIVRRRLHRKAVSGLTKAGRLFRGISRNPQRRPLRFRPNLKMYLQRQVSLFASFVANSSLRPLIPSIAILLGSRILNRLLGRPGSEENRGRPGQGSLQCPQTLPSPQASPAQPVSPRVADMRETFGKILVRNHWGSQESVSGVGSQLDQTEELRRTLPVLIRDLHVKSMLDIPCGDFNWMRHVDLPINYIGADVINQLIMSNRAKYERPGREFCVLDLVKDPLPWTDLVFCRDVLVHFSFEDIFEALQNIRRSGSTYLLVTTFPERKENVDIVTGNWRPLNMEKPPFNFPRPIRMINEGCTEESGAWCDKSMGLWKVNEV